jgi:hypothetical protein
VHERFDNPFFAVDRRSITAACVVALVIIGCAVGLPRGHERFHRPPERVIVPTPTAPSPECIGRTGPCGGDLVLPPGTVSKVLPSDIDGDGRMDIAFESTSSDHVLTWRAALHTARGWALASMITVAHTPDPRPPSEIGPRTDVALGDVDGDGDADMARVFSEPTPGLPRLCSAPTTPSAVGTTTPSVAGTTAPCASRKVRTGLTLYRNDTSSWTMLRTVWLGEMAESTAWSLVRAPQVAIGPSHGVIAVQWSRNVGSVPSPFIQLFAVRAANVLPVAPAVRGPLGTLALADIGHDGTDDVVNLVRPLDPTHRHVPAPVIWTARRAGATLIADPLVEGYRPDVLLLGAITNWIDLDGDGYRDRLLGRCRWLSSANRGCATKEPLDTGDNAAFTELSPVSTTSPVQITSAFIGEYIVTRDANYTYRWRVGVPTRDELRSTARFEFVPAGPVQPFVTDLDDDGQHELVAVGDRVIRAWSLNDQGHAKRLRFQPQHHDDVRTSGPRQ